MKREAVIQINIPKLPVKRGKVRDIIELGKNRLLIVTTDRVSAFDCIMKNGIQGRGEILNQISKFWFDFFNRVPNHLPVDDHAEYLELFNDYKKQLWGRSMIVKKCDVIPIECIVRGYLAGSAWKEYQKTGKICDIELSTGLKQCEKIPGGPIFTPSTKAEIGQHDENISFEEGKNIIRRAFPDSNNIEFIMDRIKKRSLQIFKKASAYALERGIIIADTKFEFGINKLGIVVWIDEALTPDSSRFWPVDKYEIGRDQESYDKQIVRNYLASINFDKSSGEGIELPSYIIEKTMEKYIEIFEKLTERKFVPAT